MTAASAAPFYLPSACFPDGSPPSSGGDPFQRHKSPNVVGQVLQANFGARSHDANRAYDAAAQRGLLSCEHVLDAGANFASVVVGIRLRFRQRALTSGPHMNTALEAAGAQSLLDRARAIGAVAEHVRRRVALSQEFVQLLAVVHRRIGHLVAPDQLVLGIRIHVVLVSEKTPAMPLRPTRVAVLLPHLGGLLLPACRCATSLQ